MEGVHQSALGGNIAFPMARHCWGSENMYFYTAKKLIFKAGMGVGSLSLSVCTHYSKHGHISLNGPFINAIQLQSFHILDIELWMAF